MNRNVLIIAGLVLALAVVDWRSHQPPYPVGPPVDPAPLEPTPADPVAVMVHSLETGYRGAFRDAAAWLTANPQATQQQTREKLRDLMVQAHAAADDPVAVKLQESVIQVDGKPAWSREKMIALLEVLGGKR